MKILLVDNDFVLNMSERYLSADLVDVVPNLYLEKKYSLSPLSKLVLLAMKSELETSH